MKPPLGVVVAAMLFASGVDGAEGYRSRSYVGSCNELVRMLRDRCAAAGLAPRTYGNLVEKNPASADPGANSVSQGDLEMLRSRTVSLLKTSYFADPSDFVLESSDPNLAFPAAYPLLMRNVGDRAGQFTKIPGEHCASGQTICTNSFTDAPILPVHLWEIYDVIKRMRYVRPTGYSWWTANDELNENSGGTGGNVTSWPEAQLFATAFLSLKSRSMVPSAGSWGQNSGYLYQASIRRRYAYLRLSGVPAISHNVIFYYFADVLGLGVSSWDDCGDGLLYRRWSAWDTQGPGVETTHMSAALGGPTSDLPEWCDQPVENMTSRGYTIAGAVAVIEFDSLYDSSPELFFDEQEWKCDGLGFECRECAPGPAVSWDDAAGQPVVSMPAGVPDGTQTAGERLPAFFTESFVDGVPRLTYSPDTKLLGHCVSPEEGWEYVIVERPSGSEVPFTLEGTLAGRPVEPFENQAYTMEKEADGFVLDLNDGNDIEYRFDSTGQAREVRVAPGHHQVSAPVTPNDWLDVAAERSGTRVASVASPSMLSQVSYAPNGTASEIKYYSRSGALVSSVAMSSDGSARTYKEKDASGAVVRETRVVLGKGRTEVWRGREEAGGFTGTRETRSGVFVLNTGRLVQTVTNMLLQAGAERAVSVRKRVFEWNGRGFQMIAETNGAPETAATWTCNDYYDAPGPSGRMAMLREWRNSEGSWARYLYDRYDRVAAVRGPFASGGPDAGDDALRLTRNYYAGDTNLAGLRLPAADVASRHDSRPRLVVEEALGQEVSRGYTVYLPDRSIAKRCVAPGALFDAAASLTSTTYCHTNGQFEGRTRLVEHFDGTRSVFQYALDPGSRRVTTTILRGAGEGESVTNGTRTVTVEDATGRGIEERTEDIASGLTLSRFVHRRDDAGRDVCTSNALNGAFSTSVYGCCGPEQVVDEAGIETVRDYDPLGRVIAQHRLGVSTFFEYDAFGNTIREITAAGGEPALVTSAAFDQAGRRVSGADAMGNVTTTSYATNALGGRTVTVTRPDGSTEVSVFHRDGQPASVSGTAVYPVCYEYGVTTQGEFSVEYRGRDAAAPEWVRTESDMLGRVVRTVMPNGYSVEKTYDRQGREVAQYDGSLRTLQEYDALGERFRTAVDVDGNGTIDVAGSDRVSETESAVESREGMVCRVARQYLYPDEGSGRRLLASESCASVDGSASWRVSFGRTNRASVAWDRSSASRVETAVGPDGVGETAVYTNGLLCRTAQIAPGGLEFDCVTYAYDAFMRRSAVFSRAANGADVVSRFAFDPLGRNTNTTTIAGGLTRSASAVFDSMGRQVAAVLPDGAVQEFGYDTRGNLVSRTGARQYPVTFSYDEQGRLAAMSTYRNGLDGAPDTTRWLYGAATGLLANKVYPAVAGGDASFISYSYLADGRVLSRGWARGVETRYSYNGAGELSAIDYSDSTPDVSFTYDRLGRRIAVADGDGTTAFAYDERLQLISETRVSSDGAQTVTNVLSRSYDSIGRPLGHTLSSEGSSASVSYSYDSSGRMASVISSNLPGVASASTPPSAGLGADLLYSPFASGVITGRVVTADGSPVLQSATVHDALGRVASQRALTASGEVVGNGYEYNDADQRTANVLADGSRWVYGHDGLGQVISGRKRFADGIPVGGAQFGYSFDAIGNRVSARNFVGQRTEPEQYTVNALNQYEQRTVPGRVFAAGEAAGDARVTARLGEEMPVLASRRGKYFWAMVPVSNELGLVSSTNLTITATLPVPPEAPTCLVVRTESRSCLVPPDPQPFTYDADGNLLSDGIWSYAWDAENRLVRMTPLVPGSGLPTLSFSYDYMGRRLSKTTINQAQSTTNQSLYLYDGWLMIRETVATALCAVQTSDYLYGPDLSGTLHGAGLAPHRAAGSGAGGIGGLLSVTRHPSLDTHFPVSDASGNITALVSTSGLIVAEYEYGPFGEPLRASGPDASSNPFRFSTKYTDSETGLLYYGYRYYSPSLGRWLNRDPIGEAGGENLHALSMNAPANSIDALGLALYAFDGTGTRYETWTHVSILHRGYRGIKHYVEGVGSRLYSSVVGGTTGFGGDARLKEMYQHLVETYEGGDRNIDIIGFSRGAALAREFANLIYERGIEERTVTYSGAGQWGPGRPTEHVRTIECSPQIRFLGLFDTVGSFGVPGNDFDWGIRMTLPPNVGHAAQAVARDERRSVFPLTPLGFPARGMTMSEMVFQGDHSDIGGGHEDSQNLLAIFPLLFIWGEGRSAGVPFGPLNLAWDGSNLALQVGGTRRPWAYQMNTTPHDLTKKLLYADGGPRSNLPGGVE